MPQALIKIGQSANNQYTYNLSNEKIEYLLKFANSIGDEIDEKTDLLQEIEISLKQVKKIRDGKLPRKTLTQMINGE